MSRSVPRLNSLVSLFRSRLSWRIVFWIFLSISAIEAVLMVPSIGGRRQELLTQIEEVSDGKVEWILETYPEATGPELYSQLRQLYGSPMLEGIIGGTVYAPDGAAIDSFGEPPQLSATAAQQGEERLQGQHFDAVWSAPLPSGEHTIVIRHNASSLRRDLFTFALRQGLLMLLISAFVTLVMMVVLWPSLIRPILILRRDLNKAGESVCSDDFEADFASSQLQRRDELGEVIATFQSMYGRICQAVSARQQVERELRDHNQQMRQYLAQVDQVTQAAAALEERAFDPETLQTVAARDDELGQLARVFQHAAREVQQREAQLQRQVQELQIEIDQVKRQREVAQITESGYFQTIKQEAAAMDLEEFWS